MEQMNHSDMPIRPTMPERQAPYGLQTLTSVSTKPHAAFGISMLSSARALLLLPYSMVGLHAQSANDGNHNTSSEKIGRASCRERVKIVEGTIASNNKNR